MTDRVLRQRSGHYMKAPPPPTVGQIARMLHTTEAAVRDAARRYREQAPKMPRD